MPTAVEDYLSLYERYWQRYTELLLPLPAAALNWRPPVTGAGADPATNTAAAIAAHVSGGQRYWIGEVIGGVPAQRDRAAELALVVDDASQVVARLQAAAEHWGELMLVRQLWEASIG